MRPFLHLKLAGILSLAWIVVICSLARAADFYVATNGNDAWSGKPAEPSADGADGPFATLERAREEIRKLNKAGSLPQGGVTVEVRGGVYERPQAFELAAADSGTEDTPVVYRARGGEEVRLVGGKVVTGFTPVTDPEVLGRLDEAARGKVLQVDLKAMGIADLGEVAASGKRLELFFQDQPMTVARWPNEGFTRIVDVVEYDGHEIHGRKGSKVGKFIYEGDRPARWVGEKDLWLHGYWFWDWSEQRQKVESIDTEKRVISLAPPAHGYGYRKGQWFYAFNALAELDQPGEWHLDRETGLLYFWPPASIEEGKVVVSLLSNLVRMQDVSHVTLRGFTLEACRGGAVAVSGGTGVRLVACTIRNCGGWAVTVSGGTNHGVVGSDISLMGAGGISLSGGDRKTLTPAGHFAQNNHIHHYARWERVYRPGITLQGVGNRASHNLIHNAPHMGMGFGGNDHVIELNEIHSVCYESNDAGAIYTGRNWTTRGTVVRNNYMHHINGFEGRGCVGVYLDDMFCGTEISGNLFYRVTRAAFIGGGRDCTVKNNLFVDCSPSLHIDARALGWAHGHSDMWIAEGREKGTLSGIAYNKPPYSQRYPELVNILDEEPAAPKGNKVFHNVSFGGKWDGVQAQAREYQTIENNLVDEDPLFAAPDRIGEGKEPCAMDFALKEDSPAWALGFEKLPLDQMGLVEDDTRASWPVTHEVRR
ncbi:MAG: right-handed parallel beta-helix repeat-containing protein [Planctomycetota bacterium]